MLRIATALIALALLGGCDSHSMRLEAIAEAEQHCGLPGGSIPRASARQPSVATISENVRADGSRTRHTLSVIQLGTVSDHRMLAAFSCLKAFRSRRGYAVNLHAVSPTAL